MGGAEVRESTKERIDPVLVALLILSLLAGAVWFVVTVSRQQERAAECQP